MTKERLLSLDVYRGLAVIGMMLVDWTGSWQSRYAIFDHAQWLGFTLPDFIFPSFLFAMGVAVPFSLSTQRVHDTPRRKLYLGILRRSVLLFVLGYLLNILWFWQPGPVVLSKMRLMGVLQRFAIVYPIVALLHLKVSARTMSYIGAALLVAYWAVLTLVPVPGFGHPDLVLNPEGGTIAPNLATWIDKTFLGSLTGSLYPHDPEGLLTNVPAIGTAIIGVVTGRWLQQNAAEEKLVRMFVWGVGLVVVGYVWSLSFPISKKLWTSSFVLFMGGWSLLLLAMLVWLIDVQKRRRFIALPLHFGSNAIAAIVLFTLIDNVLRFIPLSTPAGKPSRDLKDFLFENGLKSWLSHQNAAVIYSLIGILALSLLFRWLYHRRLFIRV